MTPKPTRKRAAERPHAICSGSCSHATRTLGWMRSRLQAEREKARQEMLTEKPGSAKARRRRLVLDGIDRALRALEEP